MENNILKLLITSGTKTKDATSLIQSFTWGGGYSQVARTLDFPMACSSADKNLPVVDCPPGSRVQFYQGEKLLFDGFVLSRQRDTLSNTLEISCADRGIYVKRNQAAYKFRNKTPEAITQLVCQDFDIPVGALANTGKTITRNFPGVSLYSIIQTAYTLASATTDERYMVRFHGEKLEVITKKQTAETRVIRPGANLISLTATDSIENMVNRVQILNEDGVAKGAPLSDGKAIDQYGLFQSTMSERKGEDNAAQAKKVLEDGALEQKITVEVRGNTELISGNCVVLQEPVTGLYGLCWIDNDTHTWKNGDYTSNLTLNFRNLMDEQEAGSLPSA